MKLRELKKLIEDGEGGGDFGGGGEFVGGDGPTSEPGAGPDIDAPAPTPAPPPVATPPEGTAPPPVAPENTSPPPGYGYHTALGLWGAGLMQNLYWIISGERMLARMKELGLSADQRKRVKEATKRAKKNLMDWIEGRNQMYLGRPGWIIMPVNTPYGVYRVAGKEGTKGAISKTVKSKAKTIYAKELRALPKAARKPLKKKS